MMTVEKRIEQLKQQRGAVGEFPQPLPVAVNDLGEIPGGAIERKDSDIVGGISKSLRTLAERRVRSPEAHGELSPIEIKVAAWGISRILGSGWGYSVDPSRRLNRCAFVTHRDGFGFKVGTIWNRRDRLIFRPLAVSGKIGELPSITCSASRTIGSIAADVHARLVSRGLKRHYQQVQRDNQERQEEKRDQFAKMTGVLRACRGRYEEKRFWFRGGPVGIVPGGKITIEYDSTISLEIRTSPERLEKLMSVWAEIHPGV